MSETQADARPATADPGQRPRRRRDKRGRNRKRRQQPGDAAVDLPALKVPEDQTVIVGLTGEPGAGKSSLAAEFVNLGATLIDVDAAGHEAIEGPATKKKLVATFGEDILGEDGKIDRASLAQKAFSDPEQVQVLNKIVHPQLLRKVRAQLKKAGHFVVIDAALLTELGLRDQCTQTVYVRAPQEARAQRTADRGWGAEDLQRREAALGDPEERRKACQLTVENSGDQALLETYAKNILARQLGVDLTAVRRAAQENASSDEGNGDEANKGAPAQQRPQPQPQPQPQQYEPIHVLLTDYLARTLPDLQREAEELQIRDVAWLKKPDLINEILRRVAGQRQDDIQVEGFIELFKEQHGFLRSPKNAYHATNTDTFISGQHLRRYGLKVGMHIVGQARAPRGNERCPQLLSVTEIMGEPVQERSRVRPFSSLTALHATERLFLERSDAPDDFSLRIVDLVAPIGKGQRGLIVAQPKAGKTVYLQKIANAIRRNSPEVSLLVLLVDERPEEVTDMERSVDGEVISSTFDQPASRHVQVAEIAINKAKRLVERGDDVVILLDSITRLARAYNTEAPNSGRIMSGGIESTALIKPKQFFGAARNIEEGGSLTILATALVDTGSVMDTVIFEEFKGTGNMELVLDRRLANKGIYPAIDPSQSSTRKDHLLVTDPEEYHRMQLLRRFLTDRSPQDGVEFLKGKLKNYKSNVEFLMSMDPTKMNAF